MRNMKGRTKPTSRALKREGILFMCGNRMTILGTVAIVLLLFTLPYSAEGQ
jgi:type IV secretory pathway TrbD component